MPWSVQIFWPRWSSALAALWRRVRPAVRHQRTAAEAASWRRDPLSHPAVQAMSQRELGDLPFDPRRVAEE